MAGSFWDDYVPLIAGVITGVAVVGTLVGFGMYYGSLRRENEEQKQQCLVEAMKIVDYNGNNLQEPAELRDLAFRLGILYENESLNKDQLEQRLGGVDLETLRDFVEENKR